MISGRDARRGFGFGGVVTSAPKLFPLLVMQVARSRDLAGRIEVIEHQVNHHAGN
jgi:hypothetical protein